MTPIVIYHKDCADGFAAAWCFWRKYPSWEYHPGVYNKEPPDVTNRDVYLVDFSYPVETIEKMLDKDARIRVLDHHEDMLNELKKINHPKFDMSHSTTEHSGAMIAWKYTTTIEERKTTPPVLKHIEDRDLWNFELNGTREIVTAVYSHEFTFELFNWLMDLDPFDYENVRADGAAIMRVQAKEMESIIRSTKRYVVIDDMWWCVVNSPGSYASEIGNKLAEEHPVVAIYYDRTYDRKFSLRSKKGSDVDVAAIARQYGGNGHKHAAGFAVPREHFLAKI
jgi:oligoribonuclease NrnB/cAMP/cGMP phosphodiesterase (DHH superfamily)